MSAAVKNADDPRQVKRATTRLERQRAEELEDLRAILETPAGRRWFWRELGRCRTFSSVATEFSSRIYYNAGQQDHGHWLLGEINQADSQAWLRMQQEALNRELEQKVTLEAERAKDRKPSDDDEE